jgi:arylsulfatase A-like enzyme
LRALQAVDEIVAGVVHRLDAYGILDNTYIIYTTDNGYHIGHHRLHPGKECGFEEDINIPLIIRGPGIPKNKTTEIVTAHTDIVPTIFNITGIPLRKDFDGAAIPLTEETLEIAAHDRHEHVNVEYWGFAVGESPYAFTRPGDLTSGLHLNNTYKGLRLQGKGYNLYYSVWCSHEHELYNFDVR